MKGNAFPHCKGGKKQCNKIKGGLEWRKKVSFKQLFSKKGIESGKFYQVADFPLSVNWAKTSTVASDTIQRALLELRHDQYLYAKPQSGHVQDSTKTWKSKSLTNTKPMTTSDSVSMKTPDRSRKLPLQLLWQPRRTWGTQTTSINSSLTSLSTANLTNWFLTSGTQQALFFILFSD